MVYRYDSIKASFVVHQTLKTNGATDLELMRIGTDTYLVVINNPNEPVTSVVYRWQGATFTNYQQLATNGVQSAHSFVASNTLVYLAMASRTTTSQLLAWNVTSASLVSVWRGTPALDLLPITVQQPGVPLLLLAEINNRFAADGTDSRVMMLSMFSQNSDFVPSSITLTFMPGESQLSTLLTILDDSVPEAAENFTVRLTQPQNGLTIAQEGSQITVQLQPSDDAFGVLEFSPSCQILSAEEIPGRTTYVQLPLRRTGGAFSRVVVQYEVSGQHSSQDIRPLFGTAEFMQGETEASITLSVLDDALAEIDELSIIQLTGVAPTPNMARLGNHRNCSVLVQANDSPHGVVAWETQKFVTTEPAFGQSTIVLNIIREQGTLGEIQISYM